MNIIYSDFKEQWGNIIFYNTVNFQPVTFRIMFFRGIQTLQMRLSRKACFSWTQLLRPFCWAADDLYWPMILLLLLLLGGHIRDGVRNATPSIFVWHSVCMSAISCPISLAMQSIIITVVIQWSSSSGWARQSQVNRIRYYLILCAKTVTSKTCSATSYLHVWLLLLCCMSATAVKLGNW